MAINRRTFIGAGAALAGVALTGAKAQAQMVSGSGAAERAALETLQAYMEQHRAAWGIPGLTLSVIAPGGFEATLTSGLADVGRNAAVTPDTVFQVGSITKMMTALALWSQIDEGKLSPDDRLIDLMPEIPIKGGDAITLQHLLNHTSGLPSDASPFIEGGMWVGFDAGSHWDYCNSGYKLAGMIAARIDGSNYAETVERRVLRPLGMTNSYGAARPKDRHLYAKGYEFADMARPGFRPAPMVEAPWLDYAGGAGSVASTPGDMARFMRFLGDLHAGRGAPLFSDEAAVAFLANPVPTADEGDAPKYGNGIFRGVSNERPYHYHTGGMVQFTSSLHFDVETGVAAFASANVHYGTAHRPTNVTQHACDLIRAAMEGTETPAAPAFLPSPENPGRFAGTYADQDGNRLEVKLQDDALMLQRGGNTARLQWVGATLFATDDPEFGPTGIDFDLQEDKAVRAWAGSVEYLADPTQGYMAQDPELLAAAGTYVSENRWNAPQRIYARGDHLSVGLANYFWELHRHENGTWQGAKDGPTTARILFGPVVDGAMQSITSSGDIAVRWHG